MAIAANAVRGIVATLVIVFLWSSSAVCRTIPGAGSPSVLPTGGAKALLDTCDSHLLLDDQAGLFQTVKGIGIAELRANTIMLAKLATLRHHAAH